MKAIKVLWIMSDPLPDCAAHLGLPPRMVGGWLVALSQALAREGNIELGVASRTPGGQAINLSLGGIQHFTVPAPLKGYGVLRPTAAMLKHYQSIVEEFQPDVIHVHGTEWYGGLVTANNRMGRPAIIALQGLISYHRRYLFGQLGFMDILRSRTLQEWLLFSGLWKQMAEWNRRAAVEEEIIRGHRLFSGRTLWDKAHLRAINPTAAYFHCDEMVGKEFFANDWSLSTVNRHTILASSAGYPLKGFHVLVKAVAILKREFPDIRVRVPLAGFAYRPGIKGVYSRIRGGGYANYLASLVRKLDVGEHIVPLGRLTPQQMALEMEQAHVFALPSFVENSSNTLAEALITGLPAVVPLSGGIPSLIEDGRDVLGFPPGDEALLAEQIRRIFRDDDLAVSLSKAGRQVARVRHSPERLLQRMLAVYQVAARGGQPGDLEFPPFLQEA